MKPERIREKFTLKERGENEMISKLGETNFISNGDVTEILSPFMFLVVPL